MIYDIWYMIYDIRYMISYRIISLYHISLYHHIIIIGLDLCYAEPRSQRANHLVIINIICSWRQQNYTSSIASKTRWWQNTLSNACGLHTQTTPAPATAAQPWFAICSTPYGASKLGDRDGIVPPCGSPSSGAGGGYPFGTRCWLEREDWTASVAYFILWYNKTNK